MKNGHDQMLGRRYKGWELRREGLDKGNRTASKGKDKGT